MELFENFGKKNLKHQKSCELPNVANLVFQKKIQWHLIHFILVLEKKSILCNSLLLSAIVTFWTEISASKHQKCLDFLSLAHFIVQNSFQQY